MEALPLSFFCRPAQVVGPDLVGCRLVKRQADGRLLWGVIVETEAYSQDEPACHGYRRRSPQNETLFGPPGRFYVYVSYGIHHCVNVVDGCSKTDTSCLRCLKGSSSPLGDKRSFLLRQRCIDMQLKSVCIRHLGNLEVQTLLLHECSKEGDPT